MDLLAITAPLSIINGTVQEEGTVPGLLAQPAPPKSARGREHNFLFAHLTLSGPPEQAAALAGEMTEGLSRRFFAAAGSVTSALRRAIIETNEQLLRYNVENRASHEGALSCAVLHNGELYTLQVGEGLAYVGHNFGVERLPACPPQHLTPLGRSAGIDIRFAFHRLQPGDMMLFCDPRLAYLTGENLAPVLVDTEIESGLESLMDVLTGDTARILLVEFADELPSTLPLTFQHSKQPAARPKAAARAAASPAAAERPASPPVAGPVRERDHPAAAGTEHPPVATYSLDDSTAAIETSARRVASTSARGLSRFTRWLAEVLGLLIREPQERSIHWAIPATIAFLIPLIVGAVITGVYLQRDTLAEVATIKQQMIDELALAESAGDPTVAQTHYLRVLELAGQVDELRPEDLEVARMRTDALTAMDRIDGVNRLTAEVFYRFAPGTELSRITLRRTEGGIAVLDRNANRVTFHATDDTFSTLTNGDPTTIGFGGQAVGANIIGPIFDILWLPGSAGATRDNVAMLDTSGGLFNYYPNLGDMGSFVVGNSSAWVNPVAMSTYLDRLYVLDPGSRQIWKYYGSGGYNQIEGDEAILFSQDANLDQAVDFDIYAEDASLVVLYRDGRIRYYDTRSGRALWDEATLAQSGMLTPFIAPTAAKLVGSGLSSSLYVLDPGSGRLVQLSRGGTVLAQYRIMDALGNELLTKATDFAVADSPLGIFVVVGDAIYRAGR